MLKSGILITGRNAFISYKETSLDRYSFYLTSKDNTKTELITHNNILDETKFNSLVHYFKCNSCDDVIAKGLVKFLNEQLEELRSSKDEVNSIDLNNSFDDYDSFDFDNNGEVSEFEKKVQEIFKEINEKRTEIAKLLEASQIGSYRVYRFNTVYLGYFDYTTCSLETLIEKVKVLKSSVDENKYVYSPRETYEIGYKYSLASGTGDEAIKYIEFETKEDTLLHEALKQETFLTYIGDKRNRVPPEEEIKKDYLKLLQEKGTFSDQGEKLILDKYKNVLESLTSLLEQKEDLKKEIKSVADYIELLPNLGLAKEETLISSEELLSERSSIKKDLFFQEYNLEKEKEYFDRYLTFYKRLKNHLIVKKLKSYDDPMKRLGFFLETDMTSRANMFGDYGGNFQSYYEGLKRDQINYLQETILQKGGISLPSYLVPTLKYDNHTITEDSSSYLSSSYFDNSSRHIYCDLTDEYNKKLCEIEELRFPTILADGLNITALEKKGKIFSQDDIQKRLYGHINYFSDLNEFDRILSLGEKLLDEFDKSLESIKELETLISSKEFRTSFDNRYTEYYSNYKKEREIQKQEEERRKKEEEERLENERKWNESFIGRSVNFGKSLFNTFFKKDK